MRMSPRLKARRGRFGPGGLSGPVLFIVSPPNATDIGQIGSPITLFVGTASDDLDGDISANIDWHVQGPGSPAFGLSGSPSTGDVSGASVNLNAFFDFGSPGGGSRSYTVFATVVDSGGKRSTISIAVTS